MTKEELEGYLAEGLSLEQIGKRVGRNPSTISYHLKQHGLKPVNQGRAANRGGLSRGQLVELVDAEATLSEMARQLDRSKSTVAYWLKRYGLWPLPSGVAGPRPAAPGSSASSGSSWSADTTGGPSSSSKVVGNTDA